MTKTEDNPDMRVLKTSTCNTLSGKSKLTYHIGVDPDSVIHLRVYGNSGGGAFSREWVSLDGIQTALDKRHKGQHVTAFLLQPLFEGKSVNTPAFLLAALSQEKLVRVLPGKKRDHEILDPSAFITKVEKLIASGVDVKVKEPAKPAKKTASKTASKTPVKKTAGNTPVKKTTAKTPRKTATGTTKKAAIKKRSAAGRKQQKTG